jgi:non-ribosomal peptide synthase protein (TIGR01720 family)
MADISETWEAISNGQTAVLSNEVTSFRGWAKRLSEYAQQPGRQAEVPFWMSMIDPPAPFLPNEDVDEVRDTTATSRDVTITFNVDHTGSIPIAFRDISGPRVIDVIIATLVLSLLDWRREQASVEDQMIIVGLEGHGREDIFDDVDLSRTIGWFTSLYPARIDLNSVELSRVFADDVELERAIRLVSQQLKLIPNNGIGFGILRHLNTETSHKLAEQPTPQVGINYLGRFAGSQSSETQQRYWSPVAGLLTPRTGSKLARPVDYALELTIYLVDDFEGTRLVTNWMWAPALLTELDIKSIAEKWRNLLRSASMQID